MFNILIWYLKKPNLHAPYKKYRRCSFNFGEKCLVPNINNLISRIAYYPVGQPPIPLMLWKWKKSCVNVQNSQLQSNKFNILTFQSEAHQRYYRYELLKQMACETPARGTAIWYFVEKGLKRGFPRWININSHIWTLPPQTHLRVFLSKTTLQAATREYCLCTKEEHAMNLRSNAITVSTSATFSSNTNSSTSRRHKGKGWMIIYVYKLLSNTKSCGSVVTKIQYWYEFTAKADLQAS